MLERIPNFTIKKLWRTEKEMASKEENRVMTALQSSLDQYKMEGHEKGLMEGHEKGLKEGRMEGRMEEAQEIALRMIQKG